MNPSGKKVLIEAIQKMIHELAKGNFSHRLPQSPNGELADIAFMLNLLAEELSGFFVHPNLFGEKDLIDPFIVVLDTRFTICGVNQVFSRLLKRSRTALMGQYIHDFLAPHSFKNLHKQLHQFSESERPVPLIKLLLTFTVTTSRIESWGYCHVLSGPKETYYFIRGSKLMDKPPQSENWPLPAVPIQSRNLSILQLRSDIEKIRAVHQYVLAHLHEPLPSLSVIARRFLVNEYKLKKGFKALYQTTIFKFHLDKRLVQAIVMIKNTPTSLKVIAHSLGFKSFPHFSKVFKDKMGIRRVIIGGRVLGIG